MQKLSKNSKPAIWIWIAQQAIEPVNKAPIFNRRRQPNRWLVNLLNTFNPGCLLPQLPIQRSLDLEAEIAKLKAPHGDDTTPSGSTPSAATPTAPTVQSLQGRPPSFSTFDPSSLLDICLHAGLQPHCLSHRNDVQEVA